MLKTLINRNVLPKHHFRSLLITCTLAAVPLTTVSAASASAQNSCTIPPTWATGFVPDPAILAESGSFDSLCAFHRWSWNAFLWSMENVNGVPRLETFPTLEQVIDQSYEAGDLAMATVTGTAVRLKLRAGKRDHPIDSTAQAGTTGILVGQNNRAIYYSQYVNPQMYQQIHDDNWFTAKGLQEEDPKATFAVGNIEYKAAWAIVDDDYQIPGAYVRRAMIPRVANIKVDGVTTIGVPATPEFETVDVALIGLHVVGWVKDHSEAVWATFSPDMEFGIAPVTTQPSPDPSTVVSDISTPFFKAGSTLADCNQTQVPLQKLDEVTQEFALPTQVCQSYRTGSLPKDMANMNTIDQINASAASILPYGTMAKTYQEVGAVWTQSDQSVPDKLNSTLQDILLGSTVLSNPVIETFTQTDIAQDNCFACHNSQQYQPTNPDLVPLHASMLNLSHILLQIYVHDLTNRD
jgi:hypothetical protein